MNKQPIGGYFAMDVPSACARQPDGVLLNSGRNALRHIVRQLGIKRMHVPCYTCPVVWDALKAEDCQLEFYEINEDFYPAKAFSKKDFVLYTNYFGCCGVKVDNLASDYPNLIVDSAQAYYARPKGLASFASPRKFFGVPDGGVAYGVEPGSYGQDDSSVRMEHLALRAAGRTEEGYAAYRRSEEQMANAPILSMSSTTCKMLGQVDSDKYAETRLRNFEYLDSCLKTALQFHRSSDDVPLVYPYLADSENVRVKLIENNVFVAKYWPGLGQGGRFTERIVPLPIDQRYGECDMRRVIEILRN